MRSATLTAITLVVLTSRIARPGLAQEGKGEYKAPPRAESIEVRVVDVDVVVTDRAGNTVPNLTKDDFEILEKGTPQTITNFAEIRGEPTTAPSVPTVPNTSDASLVADIVQPGPRSFLIFFDSGSIQPQARKPLVDLLQRFVDQLRPSDTVSVLSCGSGTHIVAPFTSDKGTLRTAIDRLVGMALPASLHSGLSRVQMECMRSLNSALSGRTLMKVAYNECISEARHQTMMATNHSRQELQGIDIALTLIADAPGKRSVIVAGGQPLDPGTPLYERANQIFKPYLTGFNKPLERPEVRVIDQQMVERVGRRASERGVTLYMLAMTTQTDTNDISSAQYAPAPNLGSDFFYRRDTEDSYSEMVSQTGGFTAGNTQLQRALQSIDRETSSYYSLGYRPDGESHGPRAITVRMKSKEYVARSRRTFSPRDADETMRDRVIANVFRAPEETRWRIAVRAGMPARARGGTYTVPIQVLMTPSLTLLPQGNDVVGGFDVYISVGNERGELSDMFHHVQSVRMAKAKEAAFRAEPIVFTASLTVRGGENLLSVGVIDQLTNVAGFARVEILAK